MKLELIHHLKQSLEDHYFSKSEKNSLKSILGQQPIDTEMVHFLRGKILELANEKVSDTNYRLVMQWVRESYASQVHDSG